MNWRVVCFFLFFSAFAGAEMISTQKTAFADIEKIYSRFRMKELAEKEVGIRKEKYRSEISALDSKIRQLEASMALEENAPASVSTTTAAVNSAGTAKIALSTATPKTDKLAGQLDDAKKQKQLLSAEAKESLKNIKNEYMAQIMGRIYDACAEAAEEGGYDLIIDKSNAVYGIPATDLTETILKKLK
ncbi:MAG: OmpH family outer membrane protein [Elusimicrobiota bacterium]|nr:OmpH family outer membrane protein [Elusimicrobiota bacterium]